MSCHVLIFANGSVFSICTFFSFTEGRGDVCSTFSSSKKEKHIKHHLSQPPNVQLDLASRSVDAAASCSFAAAFETCLLAHGEFSCMWSVLIQSILSLNTPAVVPKIAFAFTMKGVYVRVLSSSAR